MVQCKYFSYQYFVRTELQVLLVHTYLYKYDEENPVYDTHVLIIAVEVV